MANEIRLANLVCSLKSYNRRHSDGFFIAAAPPLQSRACCGRYEYGVANGTDG